MLCRRCKEVSTDVDDQDDGDHDPMIYSVGAEHPTMLCLTCYDDWYIAFADELKEYDALKKLVEARLTGNINLDNVIEQTNKLVGLQTQLNVQTIIWIRQGTENVLSDDEG